MPLGENTGRNIHLEQGTLQKTSARHALNVLCRSDHRLSRSFVKCEPQILFAFAVHRTLEIHLSRELNLTGIERSASGRPDCAEGRTCVVARIGDGYHAVPTEIRLIEVRMVGDVVELRAERNRVPLVQPEILEHREIKAMEAGSRNLIAFGAQQSGATRRNAIGRRCRSQGARLCKGSWVPDPEWIVNAACALDFDAKLRVLAGHENVIAA